MGIFTWDAPPEYYYGLIAGTEYLLEQQLLEPIKNDNLICLLIERKLILMQHEEDTFEEN